MKYKNPELGTIVKGGAFCGIGGFDIAADWMGWRTQFQCEPDKFCKKILKHYWPHAKNHHDITTADFSIYRGRIDVFTGGFPCQPFSVAGARKGTTDNRYLWPSMLKAIDTVRPTWVLAENVTGILSMADEFHVWDEVFFRVESRSLARLQEMDQYEAVYARQEKMLLDSILQDLEKIGYTGQAFVVPAAATGAPHRRDRVWIIAHATGDGYSHGQYRQNRPAKGKDQGQKDQRERIWNELEGNGIERIAPNTKIGQQGAVCHKKKTAGPHKSNVLPGQSLGIFNKNHNDANPAIIRRNQGHRIGESKQFNQDGKTEQWQAFPTQSFVRGRNDGFSPGLDGITLSKWRNQSIKAYGNAIVPQVALEFYRAIQKEYDKYN